PVNTIYQGKESKSSKSIKMDGSDALKAIESAFKIEDKDDYFSKGYKMATSGDGNEGKGKYKNDTPRILTLHSSALLALLCFFNVSKKNPITIDGTTYTKVFFEVQNDVIEKSNSHYRPSNIDIALISDDETKILFLESKFTEYFSHNTNSELSERYTNFFKAFNPTMDKDNFKFIHNQNTEESALNSGSPQFYLEGIKQVFCHILGIATGPKKENFSSKEKKEQADEYIKAFKKATKFEFASIVYYDKDKFDSYEEIYSKTFGSSNESRIKAALKEVLNSKDNRRNIEILTIRHNLLTYQEVFKKNNPDFKMPDKVRKFYDL
ncbi:MAG: hypothetical protein K2K97_11795, partial [Muribaculaceae bacterium]|nr:hypothetical protein [Muribaculaceae bacterium]